MERKDIYLIEWVDSASESGWNDADDIEMEEHYCYTVGYFIRENDKHVMLAGSLDSYNDHINCAMIIPKVCIIKMVLLTGGEQWITNLNQKK